MMPLFLIACVYDEGLYESSFRVVEAPSRLAVAEYMLREPYRWQDFLDRSYLLNGVEEKRWSASQLLERIDATYVDGDSQAKLSVYEIKNIEQAGPLGVGAAQ
ncbi:MAG: hypothetical protein ABI977_14660 [Acidobacteriota bacterium]